MKNLIKKTDIVSPRFAKFCLVGLANVLVDFCAFWLLLRFGVSPYVARGASGVVACLFSYLINRKWTFKAGDTGAGPLVRFAVVNAVSLCLGVALLYGFKQFGAGDSLAFFLSLPFTTAANYLGYRFWTFKHVDVTR